MFFKGNERLIDFWALGLFDDPSVQKVGFLITFRSEKLNNPYKIENPKFLKYGKCNSKRSF